MGQYLGKTATWCPQVVSLPAGTCWRRELKWTLVKRVGTRGQDPRLCRREHATTGAVQTPGPRPVTLSSEGRPLLARGSLWGPAEVSSHVLWIACGRLPLWGEGGGGRGYRRPGSLPRLSPAVLGPRGGRGHTCRTSPRACSVSNATSQSVKCQAGTSSAYPVQQRLRYVHGWTVLCIRGRRAATTP